MPGRKVPPKRLPAGLRRDAFNSSQRRKLDKCVSTVALMAKARGDSTTDESSAGHQQVTDGETATNGVGAGLARSDTFIIRKGRRHGSSDAHDDEYAQFTSDVLRLHYEMRDMRIPRAQRHLVNYGSSVASVDEAWDELMTMANVFDTPERNQSDYHANAMSVYFQTNEIQNLSARDVLEYACATRNLSLSDIQDSIRLANRLCQDLNIDAITQVEEFLVALNPEYVADLWPSAN